MLIIIGFGFYQGGLNIPLSMDFYSPPAAIYMEDRAAVVRVFGDVFYVNGTPADGIAVRLFATDQLIENNLFTDSDGFFISTEYFEAGQILTIVMDNDYSKRFSVFVGYTTVDDFYLGMFIIDS